MICSNSSSLVWLRPVKEQKVHALCKACIKTGIAHSHACEFRMWQAAFCKRAVLRTIICCGFAGVELALFLVPISVVQYMPNFFFGSLLMLFGIEITLDWLIHSFRKVCVISYPSMVFNIKVGFLHQTFAPLTSCRGRIACNVSSRVHALDCISARSSVSHVQPATPSGWSEIVTGWHG